MAKVNVGRLALEEIQYELSIRGVASTGTLDVLRKTLRTVLSREKAGLSFTYPAHPYTFDEDFAALTAKIAELSGSIGTFNEGKRSPDFARLSAKINHAIDRNDRVAPREPAEEAKKAQVFQSLLGLVGQLEDKAQAVDKAEVGGAAAMHPILNLSVIRRDVEADDSEEESLAFQSTSNRWQGRRSTAFEDRPFANKPVPVHQWHLKFTGEPSGMSVSAFLERIEELCVARNISKKVLFETAIDVFDGQAATWYRSVRKSCSSWTDVVQQLRLAYQPSNYDDQLFNEILKRTQGPQENIGQYVAAMQGLFDRLSVSLVEETRLRILMQNIAPFYQQQLPLQDPKSINELQSLGRRIEDKRRLLEAYRPPPSRAAALETDLAYLHVDEAVSVEAAFSNAVTCYNCNEKGHIRANCPQPLVKKCFRCGNLGHTRLTCPRCEPASGNANRQA